MTDPLQEIADGLGGKIEEVGVLPDGSGFATVSVPLPSNHWSMAEGDNIPPMHLRIGTDDPGRHDLEQAVVAAVRYGYRSATMNGRHPDLDPDALVQNVIVGLLGYHSPDGLSEPMFNPEPVPEGLRHALSALVAFRYKLLVEDNERLRAGFEVLRSALAELRNAALDVMGDIDHPNVGAGLRFDSAVAEAERLVGDGNQQ